MTPISGVTSRPFVSSTAVEASHSLSGPLPVPVEDVGLSCPTRYALCALYEVVPYALAAGLFTSVGPLGGAVYAMGGLVVGQSLLRTAIRIENREGSRERRMVESALRIIASIGAGCIALSLAGVAWTPGAIAGIVIGGSFVAEMVMVVTMRLFFAYAADQMGPRNGARHV